MNIQEKKRIVIKVGTSTLTHKTGWVNIRLVEKLCKTIADIKNSGKDVLLVTSGAIGMGMAKLGLSARPKDTEAKQACAAVGQSELMKLYEKLFGEYNITVAQVLLTKYVLRDEQKPHVENALERILSFGAIPIVNENDVVAIDELELEVGENDSLSAMVATLVKADLLIILSDIDGLYDSDPHKNPDAKMINVVEKITPEIEALAGGAGSSLGTGGMATKIRAAKIAVNHGIDMVILNGDNPDNLYTLFDGGKIGTLFMKEEN